MASLLDNVAVTRATALPIAASCAAASAVSSVSGRRMSPAWLPEFRGLKIKPSLVTRSIGSVSQTLNRRSGFARSRRVVCEAQDTAAAVEVPNVTDSAWQSLVIESKIPVLVEFWAPWCGPCRMFHPTVDQLAKEFAGKFKFFKVNTDESPNVASRYGIRSIPTVMIFNDGEKKESIIGAVPKETLEKSIEKFL